VFLSINLVAQNTIGLIIESDDAVTDGHTLFTPFNSTKTFLIDNCGLVINEWESNGNPNFGAYLNEQGNLYRVRNQTFEIRDWSDALIWSYPLNANGINMHHDFVVMPNNNILMITQDPYQTFEALALGKDSIGLVSNGQLANIFNVTKLVEIEPVGNSQANIVWEWKLWDHLIQDVDSTLSNYASIEDNPGKFDLNFEWIGNPVGQPTPWDWMHCNGIDYNPTLDQVAFTSRHSSEIYILDHSTTSAEAASNFGGNSGIGGQFLWRWGNPQNYNKGDAGDKKLFGPHNPRWIEEGFPNGGKLSVYNNGIFRPQGQFTSIEIIDPIIDANGYYQVNSDSRFLPDESFFTWNGSVLGTTIFSEYLGSVQFFENGNYFINEGGNARFMEFDPQGNLLWLYVNPQANTLLQQGDIPGYNWVFKTYKYPKDYLLDFLNLEGTGSTIEAVNTLSDQCKLDTDIEWIEKEFQVLQINNTLKINTTYFIDYIEIYNYNGVLLNKASHSNEIDLNGINTKIVFIQINSNKQTFVKKLFIGI